MADPITEELALDLTQALRDVNRLDDALSRMAASFRVDLADAVGVLRESVTPNVDVEPIATGIERAVIEGAATPAVVDADAENVTDAISTAVDTGTAEPAVIDGDAGSVTDAIDAAVDAADSDVALDAEAGAVTDAIDAAIADAEAQVSITADTAAAEADIAALAGEAVDITVGADTGEADEALAELGQTAESAAGGMDALSTSSGIFVGVAGTAVGNAATLENTIGRLSPGAQSAATAVGALATFIGIATANVIDAETATDRFNTQLGATADEVDRLDVSGLDTDISSLALSLGSSDDAMRNAAASIAQFGTSAGAGRDEIAQTSEEILTLAARAVALDPALGDVGAVAEGLSAALVSGRDRALIPYGIALDKSAVAAEAQRRALADGRTEISAWDKIAAGAAVTASQLGATIGDDIAAGAEKSELRMRSLRVQVDESLEAFGAPLVSPLLDLLEEGVPAATAFGDVLGQISEATLPALVPLLEVTADVLGVVASAIDAIPEPVLAGAGAFLVLTQTMRVLLGLLPGVAAGAAGVLGPIAGFVVAAGTVATVLGSMGRAEEEQARQQEEFRASLFGTASDLDGISSSISDVTAGLGEMLAELRGGGEFQQLLAENLAGLGLTAENLTSVVQQSDEEFERWKETLGDTAAEAGGLVGDIDVANEVLDDLRKNTQAGARATLEMAVAADQVSDAQRDAAISANTAADGTVNYVGALDAAVRAADRERVAQERVALANAEATGSFEDLRAAVIAGTEVDVDQWAADLGVATEEIETRISEARQELEAFVSSALSNIPTTVDLFEDWQKAGADAFDELKRASEEDGGDIEAAFLRVVDATDPQRLVENIAEQAAAIRDFQTNVATLLSEGLTNVAAFLIQQGPVVGGAIAQSLVDPASNRLALELTLADLDIATAGYEDFIRNTGAPRVLGATGDMATDAADEFGNKFRLDTGTPIDEAAAETERRAGILSRATGDLGNRSEREFASRFGIRSFAVAEIDAAGIAIDNRHGSVTGPAAALGTSAASAYESNLDIARRTGGAFDAIAAIIRERTGQGSAADTTARSGGESVGRSLGDGVASGIDSRKASVEAAARRTVERARDLMRSILGIASPSRVTFQLGQETAEGFALGLADPRLLAHVGASAEAIAQAAIPDARSLSEALDARISGLSLPPVQLAVEGTASGQSGNVTVNVEIGQIVLTSGTPAEATQVGERVADAVQGELDRRGVIARVRANG